MATALLAFTSCEEDPVKARTTEASRLLRRLMSKVDPILWTKNKRSFATPMQVFLTGNLAHSCVRYVLAISPPCRVKRRLALLASIQPRDNSAEGTPMALGPGSVN